MTSPDVLKRIAELPPEKRAELQKLLARQRPSTSSPPAESRNDAAPVDPTRPSYGQERLWFLAQLEPESPAYNIPLAVRFHGRLSVFALAQAVSEVVRRHPVLETVFEATREGPRVVYRRSRHGAYRSPVADLSGLTAEDRRRAHRRLVDAEALRPFDLARGPLWRLFVVRLEPATHTTLTSQHHVVSDGWSMGIFLREISVLYGRYTTGRPSLLPEPATSYAALAEAQRRRLEDANSAASLEFWTEHLDGVPVLELPTDRPRPSVPSGRGRRLRTRLPESSIPAVDRLAQECRVTRFMVLLAVFEVLLGRISGRRDFAVGTPVANRTADARPVIGFFVNTLALRSDLARGPAPSLRRLLERIRDTTLNAFAHQHVPFERLVERLQPERSPAIHPLFQVMMVLQNPPSTGLDLPDVTFEALDREVVATKLDLILGLGETDGRWEGGWDFSTDLFDPTTIRRLDRSFRILLGAALETPDVPVDALPSISEGSKHQVLREWSGTARATFAEPWTALDGFEAHAAASPGSLALTAAGEEISYGELRDLADRLAARLVRRGVGPETPVAVLLERSTGLVIALLAIWKAGGFYVPLDPDDPAARWTTLLEAVGAQHVVTDDGGAGRLRGLSTPVDTILRPTASQDKDGSEASVPRRSPDPDSLAYVLFTSGSTGRPKGVAVSHRAVARLVRRPEHAPTSTDDVFLQLAPVAFDASTFEIWTPLAHGARLAVPPAGALSLQEVAEAIERWGVTVLWLTAGLFHLMVEHRPDGLRPLRRLLAGGDVLAPGAVHKILRDVPEMVLVNGYGPTEVTTFTTCHPMRSVEDAETASIPIGRPIAGTEVHVLDATGRPVPPGVPGALYAGGAGLARGYFGRPARTAESFVPHEDSARPGARRYVTGDRARWLADGRLEFLGRGDHQVKVRGFRVEPGEIENALARHEAVSLAAVRAVSDGRGSARLVAWVELSKPVEPAELQRFLAHHLPRYLVPSQILLRDAVPLTPSGKVDRRALTVEPGDAGEMSPRVHVPPETPTGRRLTEMWQAILRVETVGMEDDFFDLGGHSLLATRVLHWIAEDFGVDIPLRRLFEAPTPASLETAIHEAQTARRGHRDPRNEPPTPRDGDGPAPLSYSQERLWFLDRLEPGSPVYNVPLAVDLDGELRTAALWHAVYEVVRRHPVLRSTFRDDSGDGPEGPRQEANEAVSGRVPVADLTGLTPEDRRVQLDRWVEAEGLRSFDLVHGPLWRGRLLRRAADRHTALFTQHHIVSDAWSMGIFLREVTALYADYVEGRPSSQPEPELTYADVAVWQRTHLTGSVLDGMLAAWEERLAGLPPLELPTDRPRPATAGRRGGEVRTRLTEPVTRWLTDWAREHGASPFMALTAAFQALLTRLTGQTDFGVGTPVANRPHRTTEEVIGFFVNTLVLRADTAGDPTFGELLARARDTALTAFGEQDVPFERLVERLSPNRNLASSPLFQVLLSLQNVPETTAELPGLTVTPRPHETRTSKFDLTLALGPGDDGWVGRWVFARDLLDATTVQRWDRALHRLLDAVRVDPALRVSELPLQSPAESRQVLLEWNDGPARESIVPVLLHERIHGAAARVPDRVALVAGDGLQVTYGEMAARARSLAAHLQSLGVGPERPVWVLTERSVETVTALVAVLTAGGFYVPVDSEYPEDRVALLLADSDRPVVLASASGRRRHGERLKALGACVVPLEATPRDASEISSVPMHRHAAAYAIYTSGSTGRPKGVVVPHGAVTPRLEAARYERMDDGERILHKASVSFDVSVFEIFAPLLLGARIHVVPPGGTEDVDALLDRMEREEITHVSFPPSLLTSLLGPNGLHRCPSLRRVMTGGETVPADLPERFSRRVPIPLFNRYGPTEATISVTEWRVTDRPAADDSDGPLPIGRPIHGARVYVIDRHLRAALLGATGEICLGGPSLARGYLRRPARTAAAFVPDPFGTEPGDRLYRTGDLGRWRPDGALLFLGRADGQVKIRGHRVELGDVETALLAHPGVSEAAVLDVPEPATGTRRLAAWIVPESSATAPDAGALRDHLARRLPGYMIPSSWGFLNALPVTPNGKVDRRRLAELEPAADAAEHVPPRTPAEELVAAAWTSVLDAERVGATDDFFDLGGHSLLATRVAARLRQSFAMEVPVRALFEHSTVESLAAALESLRADAGSCAPPLTPRPEMERDTAPLSFAQERFWFLAQLDPDSSVYTIPAALELDGPVSEIALAQGLDEVVRRHHVLRSTLPSGTQEGEDGVPIQRVLSAGSVRVRPRSVDLSGLSAEDRTRQVRRLGRAHADRPFDLTSPPLLRAAFLRRARDRRTVLFAMHHVVSDAWSLGLLTRELTAVTPSLTRGTPSPLSDPEIQYGDYAVWQREWIGGSVPADQVDFWRSFLADIPEALELPTDRPRPPVSTARGATTSRLLPADAAAALETLARNLGATPFMLLLAAWSVSLARIARQPRFAVGTPVAGRTRVETESLIGCFLNTLALPVDAADDPTFSGFVERVRNATLDAFAHQDVPFEKLVDELQPERSLSRTPIFQVLFVLQNVEPVTLDISGATLSPVETPLTETKFDLTLTAARRDDGLRLNLAYKTDLFDDTTARRLLGSLDVLLRDVRGVPEGPDRRVSELPLTTASERHQTVYEWNDTGTELPGGRLHDLFDIQAVQAPDADAVRAGDRVLSYAELRRGALDVAHLLAARGVGPETVVALFLDRSPELVVGMLGILYAGGAYLPLDPSFPVDRVRDLVDDSRAPVVLTRRDLAPALGALRDVETLCVDNLPESEPGRRESPRPVVPGLSEDSPAYVIYTSGSTGKPKGVVLPHRPVLVHLRAYARTIEWRPGAGFAMVQSPSVDAPVTNVWLPLLTGGCLHLLSQDAATDPREAEAVFRTHGIDALKLAPSHFKALQSGEAPHDVIPPGWLILGGEGLPTRDARRIAEAAASGARIYGSYGPTEAAVAMLSARVDGADFDAQPAVFPLGRPIPRTRALLLDDRGEPVPVGALGEIVIAGHGLARGYLGRPGRTADVFVPDPFPVEPGARMYRTGDLGRFLPDGRVEFAGRRDQQIKIRGFRIEPGEVEAVLRRMDGVRDAVVQAQADPAGHHVLVAWVVPATAAEDPGLRRALESELPPHMVPSVLVPLDALPRTPHGKLDRKALPEPLLQSRAAAEYVAPSTPLEEQLAELWAEVLGVERVGVEDDFFDLGGHSLLAIRLVSRIRRDLAVDLPLRRFFGATTVADLARLIWREQTDLTEDDELARMLAELEELSDEEAQAEVEAEAGVPVQDGEGS